MEQAKERISEVEDKTLEIIESRGNKKEKKKE